MINTDNHNNLIIEATGEKITLTDFFRAFGYHDEDYIYFRSFDDKKRNMSLVSKKAVRLSDVERCLPELHRLNDAGAGLFFVVNGGGNTDAEVLQNGIARAQFYECDDKTMDEQWDLIWNAPIAPSIIIQTAKSLHVYYLLDDGKAYRFRALQETLCNYCSGDSSIKNEARVMRLPSFYHNKGNPVMVKLCHFDPNTRYSQDQLQEAFASYIIKNPEPVNINTAAGSYDNAAPGSIDIIDQGGRNNYIYKTACKLIEAGLTREAVLDALLKENRMRFTTMLDESEIINTLDSAYRYKSTPAQQKQWREERGLPVPLSPDDEWKKPFHKWTAPDKNGNSHPKDTKDDKIVEDIIRKTNMFRLFGKIYIQDEHSPSFYRMDDDEAVLKSIILKYIHEDLLTSTRISRIYNLFDAKPQIRIEEKDINKLPSSCIVFRNGILDARTMEWYSHDPKYRCINMIPHDYDPEYQIPSDSIVKTFIESLIPQEDDREMYLEYCGLSATFDTSLQKLMMLRGQGGVGKSVLLRLQKQFIGSYNCSGLTLQNLNDRFSPAFLFGKLMNIYADTPSTDMDEINGIKTITGEDTIRAEYKGGDVFFFNPYCKLLYSTNKVPKSRDDKTNAYYRRLLILPIEKRAEHISNLEARLSKDIDSYIRMCVDAVHRMYERGSILESLNSQKEVLQLYMATDSVQAFLHDRIIKTTGGRIERSYLYQRYCEYCAEEDRDKYQLSRPGFYQNLRDKGIGEIRDSNNRYFVGIDFMPYGFKPIEDAVPF